jgi:hypothetical protein
MMFGNVGLPPLVPGDAAMTPISRLPLVVIAMAALFASATVADANNRRTWVSGS